MLLRADQGTGPRTPPRDSPTAGHVTGSLHSLRLVNRGQILASLFLARTARKRCLRYRENIIFPCRRDCSGMSCPCRKPRKQLWLEIFCKCLRDCTCPQMAPSSFCRSGASNDYSPVSMGSAVRTPEVKMLGQTDRHRPDSFFSATHQRKTSSIKPSKLKL